MRRSRATIIEAVAEVTGLWATLRSKDPNTQVGACIYDPKSGAMFLGYNGLPTGLSDTPERWQRPAKYQYVIHAEINAILKAQQAVDVRDCWLYVTHKPCHRCAGMIVQVGIKNVYYTHEHDNDPLTDEIFNERGIICQSLLPTAASVPRRISRF